MQIGDAEVLEVVEVLGDTGEVTGEALRVAGVAEHPRLLQPVGLEQPLEVEAVQVVRPGGVRRRCERDEAFEQRAGDGRVRVDPDDRIAKVTPEAVEPERERLPPVGALARTAVEVRSGEGVDLRGGAQAKGFGRPPGSWASSSWACASSLCSTSTS